MPQTPSLPQSGYNLRLILTWLRALLCLILTALTQAFTTRSVLKSAC
jgi:hypothetical protein